MVIFKSTEISLTVAYPEEVIDRLLYFKQSNTQPESGGMLFCKNLFSDHIEISDISTPCDQDKRSRFFFKPNNRAYQRIIDANFQRGHHYIGDWHTHPEAKPSPSPKDISSIRSIFNSSKHDLKYIAMLIIPSNNNFSDSYFSLFNSNKILTFNP